MNSEIYEKNMIALRKRFPNLADLVEKKKELQKRCLEIQVKNTEEESIVCVRQGIHTLYMEGKRKPKETAKRRLEQWGKITRGTPVYIVGMANIVFLKEILNQTDKSVNIMVYEPSIDIFYEMMEKMDITIYFENRAVGLVVEGLNEKELKNVVTAFMNLASVGGLKIYTNVNYKMLFPDKVLHFLKCIDQVSTRIVSDYNTTIRFSAVEADNLFHNICYLCDGSVTTQLCDILPTDIPAIVVSAGPSLNKNIVELRKAKNKAFIVAVDTAVKPLVKAGIIPDLYVVVDGLKPIELLDFEEAKRIPLMPSLSSAKEIMANHTGKKIFFNEGEMLAFQLMVMNGIPFSNVACGGSVACSAFSLVYKLGFSRIILVGQDLALTYNKTHADGTFKEKMDVIDTRYCQMVPGNCEKMVPTRADYKMYLDWFNYYIAGCEGIHVMNATEGGAKIENTEIINLKDAIDRECKKEVNIASCFEKLTPIFNEEQRKRAVEYLNKIPEMFRELKKDVEREETYYKKLKNICKGTNINRTKYLQIFNKIKKTTSKIEHHELFSIIERTLAVANYMITSEQYCEEKNFHEEGLEIARKGTEYMELIKRGIDLLLPITEDTVGKLE